MWSIIMGTTRGCASARTAEKTKAALCAHAALAGRANSLTAKSCRFHSQLARARASPRSRRSTSAAARILMAALTRWRRASYKRVSSKFRTGTPIVRTRRAMAGKNSQPRGAVKNFGAPADTRAARFVQARLQQIQDRHADRAKEASHGGQKLRAARLR